MRIAAAGNTEVPAYLVLLEKGYEVSRRIEPSGDTWIATKNGYELTADSLVVLLGVVALAETRGEGWMADDDEIEAFLKRFSLE